jgi:hypothetical protein
LIESEVLPMELKFSGIPSSLIVKATVKVDV